MASDILHIKDSYYFDVPRLFWPSKRETIEDFPQWFVRLDPDFQSWESAKMVDVLSKYVDSQKTDTLVSDWQEWQHAKHKNFAWPLDGYLEKQVQQLEKKANEWASKSEEHSGAEDVVAAYLAEHPDEPFKWFYDFMNTESSRKEWNALRAELNGGDAIEDYSAWANWDDAKFDQYNGMLHGKIMIPQPLATLRNAYETESGFAISRYMIVEVLVAILIFFLFKWLAGKVQNGDAPKGKGWNFTEGLLGFVKDSVVVPAMGEKDAKRFMPFMWTIFFFVLFLNLAGMIPFVGAPTSVLGTTAALALTVFGFGLFLGVQKFGVLGYLKNICPSLGLPIYLAVVIVPLLWVIEAASLLIKHVILAVRLLANMVAGHLVMLGILGLVIGFQALDMSSFSWGASTVVAVIATTLLSLMEVFVAFLQAAIFTFLSALFIGNSIHHH